MWPPYGLGVLANLSMIALAAGVMVMRYRNRHSNKQTVTPALLPFPQPFPLLFPLMVLVLPMLVVIVLPFTSPSVLLVLTFLLFLPPVTLAPTVPSTVFLPSRIRLLKFTIVPLGLFIPVTHNVLLRLLSLSLWPLSLPPPHLFLNLLSSSSFLLLLLLRFLPNTSTNRQAMMKMVS